MRDVRARRRGGVRERRREERERDAVVLGMPGTVWYPPVSSVKQVIELVM